MVFINGLLLCGGVANHYTSPKRFVKKDVSNQYTMKFDLAHIKGGTNLHSSSRLMNNVLNCGVCPFIGSKMCPHGILVGGHHSNHCCAFWVKFFKENYLELGSQPKVFQVANLVKNQLVSDDLFSKFYEEKDLDKKLDIVNSFAKVQRNIISLSDKMRRQDEGLKIQQDVNISMDRFRDVVDAQAKVIEGEDKKVEVKEGGEDKGSESRGDSSSEEV